MSEFPASEHDQLVTRDHLRAEIGLIRTELHDEVAGLRTEMHHEFGLVRTEMAGLRSELKGDISDLRGDVALLAARQDTFATKQDLQEIRVEMHGLVNRHLITMAGAIIAGMGLAASIT